MLIENPDALKQWMEGYLPPLCDADPEVLAKYCLALVRKDRDDDELKASMLEQLEVFLKEHTESFVEKLLVVANSKSYLPVQTSITPASPTNSIIASILKGNSPDSTSLTETTTLPVTNLGFPIVPAPPNNLPNPPPLPPLPPPIVVPPHPPPESPPPPPVVTTKKDDGISSSVRPRKEMDRDERRTRRRSRSRERFRRSRSRGRSGRSKYDDRRRRSPHSKRYRRSRSRSRTRSPRRSRSPPRRSRSRERRSHSKPNRSCSASPKMRTSHHRTRSRSPISKPVLTSPPKSPPKELIDEIEDPTKDAPNEENTVSSVISVPPPTTRGGLFAGVKSQRCRDYDEKGFCMRGDQCPYDHGSDPVVLEGASLDFPPPMSGVSTSVPPYHSVPPPTDLPTRNMLRHLPPPTRQSQFGEYTPNNPSLWTGDPIANSNIFYVARGRGMGGSTQRFPGPHSMHPPDMGRELINVPVAGVDNGKALMRPSLAKRLGPATTFPNGSFTSNNQPQRYSSNGDSCTLELRKIPHGMNNITLLNQHFSKFGSITNIQVHHDGDLEAALVAFLKHSEANAAYRSTEAVLNNRFIKLFWHNPQLKDSVASAQRPVHDRLTSRHHPNKTLTNKATQEVIQDNNDKVVLSHGSLVKTVYNAPVQQGVPLSQTEAEGAESASAIPDSTQHPAVPPTAPTTDEIKKREIEVIHKQQELLRAEVAAKQKMDKQKADAMKLKSEVEQRTHQLLEKQMQQIKILVNKLEKNRKTMKESEVKAMMSTIKMLQAATESTKARLVSASPAATHSAPVKSKSQLDKEILDTELELYAVQCDGKDIGRLKIRIQQLKLQVAHLKGGKTPFSHVHVNSITRTGGMPLRGRGNMAIRGGRGRGRGRPLPMNAVDRRTTSLHASGFEREDKEEVLTHFAGLGKLVNYNWDRHTPAITVHYSTRREAEKAMLEGRNLGDRLLTLTWVSAQASYPTESVGLGAGIPLANTDDSVASQMPITPHSTTQISAPEDGEEILEEIVEVEETVEGDEESIIYEDELDDDEEETRSWRR